MLFYIQSVRVRAHCGVVDISSSSSFFSAGQRFLPHRRTSGGLFLEWAVESTTVTHSSADW